ncbi:MAG: aspartate aminotransferase family protein [Puniceicoccaceae bacterium]
MENPPLISNYAPPPFVAVRGAGNRLWDQEGREYLDFTTGIAVNALGHAHPAWVAAIQEQAAILGHCSNLFANPLQNELATTLASYTPPGKFLFCNSGAEANEALLKLARLHGRRMAGTEGQRFHVITAANAFHGRTFGGMAATPQEKIQGGFRPMLEGFRQGKLNDIESFASAIDERTSAIFIETIQGEGGVFVADPGFLRELRALCDQHQLLLLLDEVQCGIGRTGDFFAFESSGVVPDAIGMAKGLGGGFPIGAIWVAQPHADLFQPGSHGTTFGGNPLASAAALAVLRTIESEQLLRHVREASKTWHQQLRELVAHRPDLFTDLRGRGFIVALVTAPSPIEVVALARQAGLLCVPAGNQAIRLLPALNTPVSDLEAAVQILANLPSLTAS